MLASGAMINLIKSLIFYFNTPMNVQHNITHILGYLRGSLPLKYLGSILIENALRNVS